MVEDEAKKAENEAGDFEGLYKEETAEPSNLETAVDGGFTAIEQRADEAVTEIVAPVDEVAAETDDEPADGEEKGEAEKSREPKEKSKEPSGIAKMFKHPSTGVLIGCVVVALVIGLLLGIFVFGGAGGSSITGKTVVSESELNSPIASYSASGKSGTITASEVIEQTSSLEAVKDADGNYAVPSADSVLSVARNKIIVADAESRGIAATDEEIAAYAEAQLGTSDYASIAQSYGMDEESVVSLLRESCIMSKLRDEVLGDQAGNAGEVPAAPAEPAATTTTNENGEEVPVDASQVVTKEYADYIIGLAGDEWDSAKGTWASQDGPFYQALSSYQITPEGASYEAATAAYYVAYQSYSESASAVSSVWSDYVNGLLAKATINIFTLLA